MEQKYEIAVKNQECELQNSNEVFFFINGFLIHLEFIKTQYVWDNDLGTWEEMQGDGRQKWFADQKSWKARPNKHRIFNSD